jgi:hypothetical protein
MRTATDELRTMVLSAMLVHVHLGTILCDPAAGKFWPTAGFCSVFGACMAPLQLVSKFAVFSNGMHRS